MLHAWTETVPMNKTKAADRIPAFLELKVNVHCPVPWLVQRPTAGSAMVDMVLAGPWDE